MLVQIVWAGNPLVKAFVLHNGALLQFNILQFLVELANLLANKILELLKIGYVNVCLIELLSHLIDLRYNVFNIVRYTISVSLDLLNPFPHLRLVLLVIINRHVIRELLLGDHFAVLGGDLLFEDRNSGFKSFQFAALNLVVLNLLIITFFRNILIQIVDLVALLILLLAHLIDQIIQGQELLICAIHTLCKVMKSCFLRGLVVKPLLFELLL